jgi:hypothetical protein
VAAGWGAEVALTLEMGEGSDVGVAFEDDVAASATVAAIGASVGHELLAAEADDAVAAVAGASLDFNVVDHGSIIA